MDGITQFGSTHFGSKSAEVIKKTAKRGKHMPQRTCVGCRETVAKRGMTRIVRTSEGLRIDTTGKAAGRGAYLHNQRSCWERGVKGALAHALKVELTEADRALLQAHLVEMPEDTDQGSAAAPETTGSLGTVV